MIKSDVFCLTDKKGDLLPPAVQATVLAKYSRSSLCAKDILSESSSLYSEEFQEKWVGQYGHNSVAELATIPICFEGISIIASKFIESWQRAAYSEKSTRYQVFNSNSFVSPPGAPDTMKEFSARLYRAYEQLLPQVTDLIAEKTGESTDKRIVKARAFDNVRYLLPAGTGTNVAAVMNMRDIRDMITSLKGNSNLEFVELGNKLNIAVAKISPSLLKHTEPNLFKMRLKSIGPIPTDISEPGSPYVNIYRKHLMPDPELEQASFESLLANQYGMSWEAFTKFMTERPEHSGVPDPFKTVKISFEVMMDFGAFRDLQRHRRCEQYVEPLRLDYGFVCPDDISGSKLESKYLEAMESVDAYDDDAVINDPDLMQYMIPLGYLHRSVFQMDLKELYYIVELRTKPQGHISYRRIAHKMYDLAKERWPAMMTWCRVNDVTTIGEHH